MFGTLSTRINVTFGILRFLSLGECGTREVRTFKTQLDWYLELSMYQYSGNQTFDFCILTSEHYAYLTYLFCNNSDTVYGLLLLLLLCLAALKRERERSLLVSLHFGLIMFV